MFLQSMPGALYAQTVAEKSLDELEEENIYCLGYADDLTIIVNEKFKSTIRPLIFGEKRYQDKIPGSHL